MPSGRQASAWIVAEVAGAVVGEEPLDLDAVAPVEGDCAAEEADGGGGLLVGEDFGVGEAAVVVDRDVDVLPAAGAVDVRRCAPPEIAGAADAVAGAAAIRPSFLMSMWTSSPGRVRS